jgi:hypothetical protein
MLQVKLLP